MTDATATRLGTRRAWLAANNSPRRLAVIGCGVNGLSTARMLQRRYSNGPGTVTIYARDLPPETTSNIAAGFWSPVSLFDEDAVSTKWMEQFRTAARQTAAAAAKSAPDSNMAGANAGYKPELFLYGQ